MYIEKITIENFRLLKHCTLDMRDKTTLLVGKNNTGKTSFAVLLEKFFSKTAEFNYTDFPLSVRSEILDITDATDVDAISIRLVVKVVYSEADDLGILSEFMLDLDASRRHVNILLECRINKKKLLRNIPSNAKEKKKFIENNLGRSFLDTTIYAFDDTGYTDEEPYYLKKRDQLEEKTITELTQLLNFQVIHARRNVASSEDVGRGAKPLSVISTRFYRRVEEDSKSANSDDQENGEAQEKQVLEDLRVRLAEIDEQLGDQYDKVFDSFLKSSREFLELGNLKVISNIQSQTLIDTSSQVIYGETDNFLPENHSGLGYLNILYLLLQIQLCREEFSRRKAPLNLLVIEEPEAHTHPQMQYVFADKIRGLISEVASLQAIITTHSSHIISKSDFEDIRYLSVDVSSGDIAVKNFHTDLKEKYEMMGDDGAGLFKFLKQYLTINSAELFFASKVIFIEGTTERILLPWFIQEHDKTLAEGGAEAGLSSQNITVLEVGANARAFAPFLEFIGVKTLVITDIDTTKRSENYGSYSFIACPVACSTNTSNETLKYFLSAPSIDDDGFAEWHKKLVDGRIECKEPLLKIAYQTKQNEYHARSFEDAFLSLNIGKVINRKDVLQGLKNKSKLNSKEIGFYELAQHTIDKKSDFAGSILFTVLTMEETWEIPQYIKNGLAWIHKN